MARIEGAPGINIESCDGEKVRTVAATVKPGKHLVGMTINKKIGDMTIQYSRDTCFMTVTTQEGRTYLVDSTPTSNGVYAGFITDRTTGERVAFGCETPREQEEALLKQMDVALSEWGNNADLWTRKGEILLRGKRYEEAITAFNRATALNPDLVNAWGWKSRALYELKKYSESKKALDTADRLKPGNPDSVNLRRQLEAAMARKEAAAP
jgi:hypothetical protein